MKRFYFTYIISLLLFGSNGIIAGQIRLTSDKIVLLRTLIGGIFLVVLFVASKQKPVFWKQKKDLFFLSLSGISMGASWMLLYKSYEQIGVGMSSLLYYCGPVLVMALSPILFREALTRGKCIGFACVLAGILFVNGPVAESGNLFGLFCGGMSAVLYAVMVITNKKCQKITGMENTAIQLIASCLTVLAGSIAASGFSMPIHTSDLPWILLLGLLNTGLGCCLYFSSIGKLPIQTVAVCGYLEPLSAVIFSAVFLSERMLPLQIFGAALIIGGAVFTECIPSGQRKSSLVK